ncbi:MAG TPA: START domain-containing protein [Nitrospira sp.]|nr:START domain-containing protein [Nitrospira sp.]
MLRPLLNVLLAAVLLFSLPALAYPGSVSASEDAGWELVADDDGIEVFARSLADSPVREVRAITEIPTRPDRVFAVLLDSDRFIEFMPYIVEVRTVERNSPSIWYLYQRISPPLVSDRDYTLRHQSVEEPQRGRYELRWEAANERGPKVRNGVVRVEICTGAYVAESIAEGARTRLTYQLHTDPGGMLPKWLADRANIESVPALLRAVRRRAMDPNYHR